MLFDKRSLRGLAQVGVEQGAHLQQGVRVLAQQGGQGVARVCLEQAVEQFGSL
jgi:hypothetical protein